MIRPVSVNNYKTNYKPNIKPNFGHTDGMMKLRSGFDDNDGGEKRGFVVGLCMGLVAATVFDIARSHNSETEKSKVLNKLFELQNSKNIKKDVFTIKDVTDDRIPDIILYKKDGSQVVFDVKNDKFISDKKNSDED